VNLAQFILLTLLDFYPQKKKIVLQEKEVLFTFYAQKIITVAANFLYK